MILTHRNIGGNQHAEAKAKSESAKVIRISVYSDNLAVLWKSIQKAFEHAGFSFLLNYACPSDDAVESLLADDLCHEFAGDLPCYIFIDDFHLLTDSRVTSFLCTLADRLPVNVHLLVAGRDCFLSAPQLIRLGNRVHTIGADLLRLNHTELSIYAHRCGLSLADNEIDRILSSTEGWFAAVYLNLRTLLECGVLPDSNSDIYTMFTEAMIEPLSARKREFLAVMGLCDEFTAEMAAFVTGDAEAERTITLLTEQNAFAKRLSDGKTYRFHHMMKECAQRTFHALPEGKQTAYSERLGLWYEKQHQYLHAMAAYRQRGNFDGLLRVIRDDAGILLASLNPETILNTLYECPVAVLKEHPLSILVLMRSMFNWRQIPKMMELKQLLLTAMEERPEIPPEERKILETALKDASPDGFLMPFVENYAYLKDLLQADALERNAFVLRIIELGKNFELRKKQLRTQSARPALFETLTEREYTIVRLIAERLSNREIAEKLFLSEGSVKQYVSQIYAKLGIDGDTRTKKKLSTHRTRGFQETGKALCSLHDTWNV